jgi:release factor glutamine methyltransferase
VTSESDPRRVRLGAARRVGEALGPARVWLREAGVGETPELDAQVLLAHVTGWPRTALIAYPERELTPEQAGAYAELVARRAAREPVAYLTGHRDFLGLDFATDARALIPRPETELLAEEALRIIRERLARDAAHPPLVADIGTGSGAIAVSIAALEPRLPLVYATDISAEALALARENAAHLGVAARVRFLPGDLLEPLPEPVDLLVANLPYVAPRDATTLPENVTRYEPSLALYGAEDGLGHLRRFFARAGERLRPGGVVLVEFGYDQRAAVEALARATFPHGTVRVFTDYAGWDRYARVESGSVGV